MMSFKTLLLIILLLVLLMVAGWLWRERGRRNGSLRVRHFAFPQAWLGYLERNVALYRVLPVDLRERLQDHILNFVDGKRWKHCGGLEAVTDEMKVTIAGQACFLILCRDHGQNFNRILTIMVYPSATPEGANEEDALPPFDAWPSASVLLAWDEVKKTARDLRDERNEVLHEFARLLDLESGQVDGTPLVRDECQHTAWARVMSAEFLRQGSAAGGTLADKMKVGDPGEVFAAATELFFEMPGDLSRRHPDLYEMLRTFYKLDPARWRNR